MTAERDYFPQPNPDPTLVLLDVGLFARPGPDKPTAVDLVRAAIESETQP